MPHSEDKQLLRLEMRRRRDELDPAWKRAYDLRICDALLLLADARKAKTLHAYLPMGSEIDIRPFIAEGLNRGWQFAAPRTLKDRRFSNLQLADLHDLEPGVFGTQHPTGNRPLEGPYDLIVVPALTYDTDGFRIGYGGGYYDAFLAAQAGAYRVGLAYPFQVTGSLPREPHDVPVDEVLCFPDAAG